eukprot:contig_4886_g1055
MSNFFIAVMKVLGVETVRTTAYHPQTNGQVERYIRTIATQLRHYVTEDPKRPLARKRVMARLGLQIPTVVKALTKTQQRYKCNFDAHIGDRNRKIKIGDYVYTTNHQRANKLSTT